jgi:hypothetical protein
MRTCQQPNDQNGNADEHEDDKDLLHGSKYLC